MRRLRWGILGTAAIARQHVVPAIHASHNGIVCAVAGRDPDRTRAFALRCAIPRLHHDYASLLADSDIDVVYIPLPNALHADWTIRAVEAGKAVLCEKPLALNAEQARRMVQASAAAGVGLMEASMIRFHPQNVRARALIDNGAIGDVREVRAHLSVTLHHPPDPKGIRFSPATGGGALLDAGCYPVSIVRDIFGEEPYAVSAMLDMDASLGVDMGGAALLLFSAGRAGLVSWSYRSEGQGGYTIVGSKGVIEVPRAVLAGQRDRLAESIVILMDARGARTEELIPPANHYLLMVEAFADAILGGHTVPYPMEDSVRTLDVLDSIKAAAHSTRQEPVARTRRQAE